jgi:predicted RNA-binding protein with PUA-like domain
MIRNVQYWLMKSEPDKYSWQQLVKDQKTCWDGIRNYQARNNIRTMKVGDLAFFYHSNLDRQVMGIMKIVSTAYPDPKDAEFSAIDVAYKSPFKNPVTLKQIKENPALAKMQLLRQSRLSIASVTESEFKEMIRMSEAAGA